MELLSFSNWTTVSQTALNESELWSYIAEFRGNQRQPLLVAIPLTIINVVIFITGIFGNVAVCIVIQKNPSLHSATHYFLFNLAVADILLLVFGLPNDVSLHWQQYPWELGQFFCKFRGLISEMASYVTVMTIVVFSTERYLAICHPLHIHTLAGLSRATKIIAILWFIGFAAALPFFHLMDVDYLYYQINATESVKIQESALCAIMNMPVDIPLFQMSFGFFFVVPLCIIIIQYIKMSSSIFRSEHPLNGVGGSINTNRIRSRAQSNKSIVRMLLSVVVGFFCCWAPFHAQRLMVIYASHWKYITQFNYWMFWTTGILYYFSSTLNPILYNLMSRKMRNAFKRTFGPLFGQRVTMRNSDLSSTTIQGRISRSFRDDNQLINSDKRPSFKRINTMENNQKCLKRDDLLKLGNEDESIL